jgi:hypothetical protein
LLGERIFIWDVAWLRSRIIADGDAFADYDFFFFFYSIKDFIHPSSNSTVIRCAMVSCKHVISRIHSRRVKGEGEGEGEMKAR